jgi:hypothetical protein
VRGPDFLNDLFDRSAQLHARLQVHRQAPAQPAAGEIQNIVDQPAHAMAADLHLFDDLPRLVAQFGPFQHFRPRMDGGQRIAQVMAQDGDELVAQLGGLACVQ